jgi:hypothetical protein
MQILNVVFSSHQAQETVHVVDNFVQDKGQACLPPYCKTFLHKNHFGIEFSFCLRLFVRLAHVNLNFEKCLMFFT